MRSGRRLALDVGKARIGVAVSDPHGILASPAGVVLRAETVELSAAAWLEFLKTNEATADYEFLELYVGLPVNLKGEHTESTRDAIEIGAAFAQAAELPVRFIDERLSTVSAAAGLRASGKNAKQSKSVIDSVAATLILESALANERLTEGVPGLSLEEVNR